MSDALYTDALFAAYRELTELGEQERAITVRKAQLRETVNALYPLVFPDAVDINSLSLPDAMRLVFRSAGRPLNAHGFRIKLEDMGFDLSKFSNPLANILTAMNRMVEAEEMTWVEGEKKTVIPGPELKQVPEAPQIPPPGFGGSLLPFLANITTEEKK
jgi:hypothetical protein